MSAAENGASAVSDNLAIIASQYATQTDQELVPSRDLVTEARIVPIRHKIPRRGDPRAVYPTLPRATKRSMSDGGVYDSRGMILANAIQLKGNHLNIPLPDPEPRGADARLPGNWIYGGRLQPHFGHFLTESLGRLWCFDDLQGFEPAGVVFIWHSHRGGPGANVPIRETWPFVGKMLDLLRIDCAAMLVGVPTVVERLLLPGQLMRLGDGPRVAGHPAFRHFIRRLADHAAPVRAAGPEKLFVSRSRLKGNTASPVLENWLDALFAAAGYHVMYPETMPLEDQISRYCAAKELVFTEGSALHLFGLIAKPEQRVGIIQRTLPAHMRFHDQLTFSGVSDVRTFDAIAGVLMPGALTATSEAYLRRGRLEPLLDFHLLADQLSESGFVPKGSLPPPTEHDIQHEVQRRCRQLESIFSDREFALIPRADMRAHIDRIVAS